MNPPLNVQVEFPKGAIHLVWFPITAFLVAEALLALLARQPVVSLEISDNPSPTAEGAARLQYLALMMLFFLVSLAAIYKFFLDFTRLFDRGSARLLLIVWCSTLAAAGLILIPVYAGYLPGTENLLDTSLFLKALDFASRSGRDPLWSASVFESLRILTSIVTALALAGLVTGGI